MSPRRPVSTMASEERASLDTEWTKEISGKRNVTSDRLAHPFDADIESQSTSQRTSSLERTRSWNLSALKNIGAMLPTLPSVYKFRTASSREVTSMPFRKLSADHSNSMSSTRVGARTTNSTVRDRYPGILDNSDVQTQPPVWTKVSQLLPRHLLLASSRSSPSRPATKRQRNSPKLLPRIYWAESVISMVLQLKIVGLHTSGTKRTGKQRMKNRRGPSSQNLGNYLPRPPAEVSSQGDSIGTFSETIRHSGIYHAQGRRIPLITHRSLGQCP